MTSASHRGARGPLLSRRNKCVVFTLFCVLAFLILVNSGLFSGGASYTGELCKLDDIDVQDSFDKSKFAGNWYGTFTKGLDNSLVATMLEFYDVKIKFILKDDGNFDIASVGAKFYGMWCPEGEGHADSKDSSSPQKLGIYFDTPTGKKFGTKPAWILKTDYTSYAIIYSCWEQTDDGHCAAKGAYAVIIQRKREKLPETKMAEIKAVLARSCLNPNSLREIKHKGYCKKIQNAMD